MLLNVLRLPSFLPILIQRSMASTSSSEYSACITTVPSEEAAHKLARSIIEARLGACVNIIPNVISVYEWQSAIQVDKEFILLIKTRRDRVAQLIDFVTSNHSYEVPELIELPILSGHPAYLTWINNMVKEPKSEKD